MVRKGKQAENYNRRYRSKSLSELKVGDSVWMTDLRVYGVVTETDSLLKSYKVETNKS